LLPIACNLFCYRQVLGRERLIQRLDTVLSQVAAAGYVAVQHFIDCIATEDATENFAELLAKYNLKPAGIFTYLNLRTLTINPDPLADKKSKSDEQLVTQAEALIRISEQLNHHGIRLIYHFGGPEMAKGASEFKRMMHLVPSHYMGICYDPDWVARSGMMPGDLLDQFAPRVEETHLRSSRDGIWDQVLGDGDVNLADVIELLDDYDFRGWHIVALARETKTPKSMSLPDALQQSCDYVRDLMKGSHAL